MNTNSRHCSQSSTGRQRARAQAMLLVVGWALLPLPALPIVGAAHAAVRGDSDVASRLVTDTDGDGVPDSQDNCLLVANANQRDTNADGLGNRCDPDLDNNGAVNFLDLARMKSVFFTNDPDADLNGDGSVNFLDLSIMKSYFFLPPGPTGYIRWVNPAGGDWNVASNWFPVSLPQPESNVIIDMNADITITHASGNTVVNGLISNNALVISGGSFEVLTTMQVNNLLTLAGNASALRNTTVLAPVGAASPDSGILIPAIANPTLDGVTLAADMTVSVGANVSVSNGLTLAGSTVTLLSDVNVAGSQLYFQSGSLDGSGELRFDGTAAYSYIYFLSCGHALGPDIVIRSGTTGGSIHANCDLTVEGTILSQADGQLISVSANPLTNSGVIQGSGGGLIRLSGIWSNAADGIIAMNGAELELFGNWTNAGQITVSDGLLDIGSGAGDSFVNTGAIDVADSGTTLGGTFALADLGNFTTNAAVTIDGVLDNDGNTLDLDALPGGWLIGTGATVFGGIVDGASGLVLEEFESIGLDGVTLAADMTVSVGANVSVFNGLTLAGSTVRLLSDVNVAGSQLYFQSGSLDGSGELRFDGTAAYSYIYFLSCGHALGPDIVIRSGTTGGSIHANCDLTVEGTVLSALPDSIVSIAANPLTNSGTFSVSAGATLSIGSDYMQTAMGLVSIEIGGPLPEQVGLVHVVAPYSANLNGTLSATLSGGYIPAVCDSVRVINWATHQNTFATFNGPALTGGTFALDYRAFGLQLTAPSAAGPCRNLSLLGGAVAAASSETSPGYAAALAIDGVDSTQSTWLSASGDTAPRIDVILPSDSTVQRLRVVTQFSPTYDFLTARFRVFNVSNVVVYDSGIVALSNGEIDLDIPDTAFARKVRLLGVTWNNTPGLAEFEVLGRQP